MQLRVVVLIVQGILSKLVAFINSLPVYWLILRLVDPATVSGESLVFLCITVTYCVHKGCLTFFKNDSKCWSFLRVFMLLEWWINFQRNHGTVISSTKCNMWPLQVIGAILVLIFILVLISISFYHFYCTSICEAGLGSRNSVCPSVHLSVTRVDCDKSKWCTAADILIPHERAITLLLWH